MPANSEATIFERILQGVAKVSSMVGFSYLHKLHDGNGKFRTAFKHSAIPLIFETRILEDVKVTGPAKTMLVPFSLRVMLVRSITAEPPSRLLLLTSKPEQNV